jgi:hypothetical protein
MSLESDVRSPRLLIVNCTVYWINNQHTGRIGLMPRPRGGDWLGDEIVSLISRSRGFPVPDTNEQLAWVRKFAAWHAKDAQ